MSNKLVAAWCFFILASFALGAASNRTTEQIFNYPIVAIYGNAALWSKKDEPKILTFPYGTYGAGFSIYDSSKFEIFLEADTIKINIYRLDTETYWLDQL